MTELADRPVATVSTPAIGRSVRRKEDDRLLTGATNWTDNIQLPGALHMVFVRSPHAHARITRVDLSAARLMPGVVAAFDAAELGETNPKVLCVWGVVEGTVMPEFPALASGEVRYVGDCVAVVLATDRYLAADAAEAVEVDYQPSSTWRRRSPTAPTWCTPTRAATSATPSTTPRATTTRPSPTVMSWSSGGSCSSG